jgi:hypothetical protein
MPIVAAVTVKKTPSQADATSFIYKACSTKPGPSSCSCINHSQKWRFDYAYNDKAA